MEFFIFLMELFKEVLQYIPIHDLGSIASMVALAIVFLSHIKIKKIDKAIRSDREKIRELLDLPEVNSILDHVLGIVKTCLYKQDSAECTNDIKENLHDANDKLVHAKTVLSRGIEQVHGHSSKDLHDQTIYHWDKAKVNYAMKYAKKALDFKKDLEQDKSNENREERQQCYDILIRGLVLDLKRESAIHYTRKMKEEGLKPCFTDKYLKNDINFIMLWINNKIRFGFKRLFVSK